MIHLSCSSCQKKYAVADQHAGRKMRCKQCSGVIVIPAAPPTDPDMTPPYFAPSEADETPPLTSSPPALDASPPPPLPEGAADSAAETNAPPKKLGLKKGPSFPKRGLAPKKLGAKSPGPKKYASKAESGDGEGGSEAQPGKKKSPLVLVGAAVLLVLFSVAGFLWWQNTQEAAKAGPKVAVKAKDAKAIEKKEPAPEPAAEAEKKDAEPEDAAPKAEKSEALPDVDPLAFVPKDFNVIGSFDVPRILSLPWVKSQATDSSILDPELAAGLKEAGIDPLKDIHRVWLAMDVKTIGPDSEPPLRLFLIEAKVNRGKLIEAFTKHGLLSDTGNKVGKHEILEIHDRAGEPASAKLTFLSEMLVLVGQGEAFDKALGLAEGGDSIKANDVLKKYASAFTSKAAAWAAADLPEDARKQIEQHVQIPGGGGVKAEGAFLAIDVIAANGLKLDATVHCASPEEAKKLQGFVGPTIAMTRAKLPPPVQELLKTLKLSSKDAAFRASIEVSAEMQEQLKQMVPMMMGMGQPPGGGPPGGLEPPVEAGVEPEKATESPPEPAMEKDAPDKGEPAKDEDEKGAKDDSEGAKEEPAEEPAEKDK